MAGTLQEIQARLKELEKNKNTQMAGSDRAVYPFWNIKEGDEAVLRFLPDSDPENVFFWVERQMIRLKFSGVAGAEESKPVTVTVPCMEMYGEACPILTKVRPWFKDQSMDEIARSYWKKRSYLFQGLVVEDPMNEERTDEDSPIRRFIIGPQIFEIIKDVLMDEDMENIPTDLTNGTDFRLIKTSKGSFAVYTTSKWARRERSLDQSELDSIEEAGLNNLSDFIPKKPSAEQLQAIIEMFEASQQDELYDPERWATFYKPYGVDVPSATATEAQGETSSEDTKSTDIPFGNPDDSEKSSGGKKSADEILAMIQSRKVTT